MFGSAAVSTPTLPLVFQPPGGKCETKTVLPLSAPAADNPAASLRAGDRAACPADVGDNLLAHTCTALPNLLHSLLKN